MKKGLVHNEIGSEFWDVPAGDALNTVFPDTVRWFISGTSALEFILQDILLSYPVKSAALPSWCCGCMIEPFLKNGIQVFFYAVYPKDGGGLIVDFSSAPVCDVTLSIAYFGYGSCLQIGSPSKIVIRDLTHSLFLDDAGDGTYCFGSLRKWAGFWTGGYAWKTRDWDRTITDVPPPDGGYISLRKRAMEDKYRYLTGSGNKDYLKLFEEAEKYLDHCGVMGGCQRDVDLAKRLDVSEMKEQRRENATRLLSELRDMALFPNLGAGDCPLFVPILLKNVEKRDALRRLLIEQEIYCPIHWGITNQMCLSARERYVYDHGLSIVCDQRYNAADMDRILASIREFA